MGGAIASCANHPAHVRVRLAGCNRLNGGGELRGKEDAVRFLKACQEFQHDPVDLLYRLTSRKVSD